MSYANLLTTYHAHLVAAGTAVSPQITTVVRGEPTSLTTVPVIGYWWGGRRPSIFGGVTLASVSTDEALVTTIYVPDSVRLPSRAESIEDYLRDVVDEIHNRVLGDAHLGENAIGIDIEALVETSAGWASTSNITARTATFTLWAAIVDAHTISN